VKKISHIQLSDAFISLTGAAWRALLLLVVVTGSYRGLAAQSPATTAAPESLTLQQCIDYSLKHQPALRQSVINIAITKTNNIINISGWMPQVGLSASFVHYDQLPTSLISSGGNQLAEHIGVANTLIPTLSVTQAIFSPNLLYSATSSHILVKQAQLSVDSNKIAAVVSVTKAFYNLLLTIEQINVLKEDTVELGQSLRDAYNQYIGGIVDETDYEQAQITLNNTKAQLRQAVENVAPLYASLKQLMGYPTTQQFNVSFDTIQMAQDINIDSAEQLQYENRIEYKQIETAKALQKKIINYNKLAFLPTLNAYYDYNYELENSDLPKLFNEAYPNSLVGVGFNFPIFTGLSRVENIHKSKLQFQLIDISEENLKSIIYTQYATALANYKSNLYNLQELQENVALSKRVYGVVTLQYKQGIVPYLNVITAESNLITSEVGYINALFDVLSSKVDLKQAMGDIAY
jgi:outer membrane protein TolC